MKARKSLYDIDVAFQRLTSAGMSQAEAASKAELLVKATSALQDMSVDLSGLWHAFFVPGRLECLGKHTDYAGGRSLICTIERGFVLVSSSRPDQFVRIIDADTQERTEFTISPQLAPTIGHWANYPMTVAVRLARNFPGRLRGADIAFISDLPPAAGMSSSSALIIAFFLAISAANGLSKHREYQRNIDTLESLASYLGTIENGQSFGSLKGSKGVGTFGGSEDHTAILCSRAGMLSCYSYCPVRLEQTVAVSDGYVFAIASSGVIAAKTGQAQEKYNRASRLASAVLHVWNEATGRSDPHLAAALASSEGAAERLRDLLRQKDYGDFTRVELLKRFEHFVAESEQILPAAIDALNRQDMTEFGRQVDRSQKFTEELLGNQVPNTIFLPRCARELGAVAASAFGAGFGGAVWALIRRDGAEKFLQNWSFRYHETYPLARRTASFFLTKPGPPALCIESSIGRKELLFL